MIKPALEANGPAVVDELQLVEVAAQPVLGLAAPLSDGSVLVDAGTHPDAVVAAVRGAQVWDHLKQLGNGYVLVRSTGAART